MAKTKISEFSTTPGSNTDINGINIAEGCAPSGINNAIRELMSDLKEWQSGAMDVYVIPQGTAAAPGIQLYGDLDTGLYGAAANQLGVSVGGSSIGYFSSDGWVGNVVATTVDLTNIEVTNIKAKDGTASIALADSTGVATFSKPTVMSVDSASDALRITQIGAGNALLVEDSVNPDSTPFVVTATGFVGVGTLSPTRSIHVSAASGLPGITLESSSNGASSNGVVVFNRTTTSTLTNQNIGSALWSHNLTDATLVTAASIIVTGNNTAGANTATMTVDAKTSTVMKVNGTEVANFASGGLNVTGVVDVETVEVTNLKAKDGTAAIAIADSTGAVTVSTLLNADNLRLDGNTLSSTNSNGNVVIAPNGTGDVQLDADTVRIGDSNANATLTTNGTGDLIINTNSGTNSGSITIEDGVNGNILIATNGTGQVQLTGDLDVATIEVTNLKAKDGTASASIADSTGVMTIASSVLTTADINGGTIDGAVIGGSSAAAGTFTTITGTQVNSDNLRLDGNTISSTDTNGNIVVAPNGSGITTFNNYIKTGNLEVGQAALGTNLIKATNTNGGIYLQANGTGLIFADASSIIAGNASATTKITTNGASDLVLDTNDGSNSGSITIQDDTNGNILISPNGTGQVQLSGALDVTNIEVTNIKAKDGTAALSIADSTGVVSVSANPVLSGGTANGVVYLNASKVATSGTALTFDGSTFKVSAANLAYIGLINGTTRGMRFGADTVGSSIEGVDNTGIASYQPLSIGGADLRFTISGTEKARITSGGQVNIGGNFTSTNNTLQVTGNAAIGYTTAAPTTGLIVAGNVGVGTDSVFGKLAVQNTNVRMEFKEVSSSNAVESLNNARTATAPFRIYGSEFKVFTGAAGSYSDNLTLDSSGNLGLGGTAPLGQRLYVAGGAIWHASNQYNVAPGSGLDYEMVNRSGRGWLFYTNDAGNFGANITQYGLGLGNTVSGSGMGIAFPATQSASTNANTLDDYEEGTFTPVVSGTTTAGTGTYDYQIGRYIKVGKLVTFTIDVRWTAHTGTGDLTVTGLPFTSVNVTDYNSPASFITSSVSLTAGYIGIASVANNTTSVSVAQAPTGGGSTAAIPMDTFGIFLISGTYEATA